MDGPLDAVPTGNELADVLLADHRPDGQYRNEFACENCLDAYECPQLYPCATARTIFTFLNTTPEQVFPGLIPPKDGDHGND